MNMGDRSRNWLPVKHLLRRSAATCARACAVAGAVFVGAIALSPKPAEAAIVERVVAVVGERPILLSELRQRARPHIVRIALSTQNPSQQAAAESEMFRELLTRLIDERLEEQAADKAHLTVTPEEVDNGIRQVAAQARMDPKQLVAEAKRQGLTEQDYRDEIRRQVLEGKLIQLRVRGRVRVTEQDARSTYNSFVKEMGQQSSVDLRILVLSIPPGASQQTAAARVALAEELSRRGNAGEDFCQLVLQYSDDPSTKDSCGSRGPMALSMLLPELQEVAKHQKPGETSAPIVFRDPSGQQAALVVQTVSGGEQGKPPAYEQVQEQMMERAYVEATERQRKLWLQELRRGVYIDVRL
ncbi:MAG: SurA N-terminal domain-containing protein [Myxococcales bacterium]|nr:SurA N-terminal domain-containing protein [Myxococcales bacterium]